jgi:hypothetical protein
VEIQVEQHEREPLALQAGEGLGDAARPRLDIGRVPDAPEQRLQRGVAEARILDARLEVVAMESGEGVEEVVAAVGREPVDEAAGVPLVDARLGQRAGDPVGLDAGERQGDRRVAVVVAVVHDALVDGAVERRHLHAALPRPAPAEVPRDDVVPTIHPRFRKGRGLTVDAWQA